MFSFFDKFLPLSSKTDKIPPPI